MIFLSMFLFSGMMVAVGSVLYLIRIMTDEEI